MSVAVAAGFVLALLAAEPPQEATKGDLSSDSKERPATLTIGQMLEHARDAIARYSAANDDEKSRFQRKKALDLVLQAVKHLDRQLQKDRDHWDSFPKFIDPKADPELFGERRLAETRYLQSQLQRAACPLLVSQLVDGEERTQNLKEALEQYEQVHKRYRSQIGGLHARVQMGRCLQELGEVNKALGIYQEVLGHPARSPSLIALQDSAQHQQLRCFNGESRKDYVLVVNKATAWIQNASEARRRSGDGPGIRWQLVRAHAALAGSKRLNSKERLEHAGRAVAISSELMGPKSRYRESATTLRERMGKLIDELQTP